MPNCQTRSAVFLETRVGNKQREKNEREENENENVVIVFS